MTDEQKTPPGWYQTSVPGEERWWDGEAWTAHARPLSGAHPRGVAPSTESTTPAAQKTALLQGNPTANLVGAIVFALCVPFPALVTLLSLFSGPVVIAPAFATLCFIALSVFGFVNYSRLRNDEAAARRTTQL